MLKSTFFHRPKGLAVGKALLDYPRDTWNTVVLVSREKEIVRCGGSGGGNVEDLFPVMTK